MTLASLDVDKRPVFLNFFLRPFYFINDLALFGFELKNGRKIKMTLQDIWHLDTSKHEAS